MRRVDLFGSRIFTGRVTRVTPRFAGTRLWTTQRWVRKMKAEILKMGSGRGLSSSVPHTARVYSVAAGVRSAWRQLVCLLGTWHARNASRRALWLLDDHLVKDIGLSPADVAREAGKPFWLP
jgi:uncharacterized protein YjiS (DUF1127 family)